MNLHPRHAAWAVLTLGLTLHTVSARADVFDWNNITYAPTAAQAQTPISLGNSANGSNSATIRFTLNSGATFGASGTNASGAFQYPISASYSQNTSYASGGGANAQKFLQIGGNLSGNTPTVTQSLLVSILFAQPVVSATFSFFDVDTNAANATTFFTDRVSAIQGSFNGGTAVIPTVTNTGSTTDSVSGNVVTGTGTNAQNAAGSNALVTFDSTTPITQLTFVYGDAYTGANHATTQVVALSNLTFTTVPEPGTVALLTLGMFGVGTAALRRRRR